ncbi:MAG: ATPase [Clostridia bacterium]|nr:ATPase [Clostridia bacterium]
MEIDRLLDELEDILEISWQLPLSGGKAFVDTKEVKRILEDIRLKLPSEVMQAKKIVSNRTKILENTHTEAENIIKASEEKVKTMVSQTEIVKAANANAKNIISEANAKSKDIIERAHRYVDGLIKSLDDTITQNLSEIKKARQMLRSSAKDYSNLKEE